MIYLPEISQFWMPCGGMDVEMTVGSRITCKTEFSAEINRELDSLLIPALKRRILKLMIEGISFLTGKS